MPSPPPVAVQLYTLREDAAVDLGAVIDRVAGFGATGVELAGFHGLTPATVRSRLDAAGLVAASGHVGSAEPDALARSLDDLLAAGCTIAVLAFLPPEAFADADAVARSADTINRAAAVAHQRGMTFGYHNHFWELRSTVDGRPALMALFDRVDPAVIAELDIYWARVGGADPAAVICELGDRLRLLHVKDGPADDPQAPMVAVGSGVIDIAGALAASDAVAWHIVELDRCATDMATAVRDSIGFLVGNGFSRGR
jgi:sugar phosphate isomerase/epimerase